MRSLIMAAMLVLGVCGGVAARERSLKDLPKDAWDLAFVWTEPVKQAAKDTRRFDPISGLWFGLLEGSVKSVERTAEFLFPTESAPTRQPENPNQPLLRYSF